MTRQFLEPVNRRKCPRCGKAHDRCGGHTRRIVNDEPVLKPCNRWPTQGATVCTSHGAKAPAVAAKAAVRAEVIAWGLDAPRVDPGETLLSLIALGSERVRLIASELRRAYEAAEVGDGEVGEIPARLRVMIGWKYDLAKDGTAVPVEEAIRGLQQLDLAERRMLGDLCAKAMAAGLAERMVRLAERQVDVLESIIRAALSHSGLAAPDQARVIEALPVAITEVVGVA